MSVLINVFTVLNSLAILVAVGLIWQINVETDRERYPRGKNYKQLDAWFESWLETGEEPNVKKQKPAASKNIAKSQVAVKANKQAKKASTAGKKNRPTAHKSR